MRFTQSWLAIGAIVVAAGALPIDSMAKPSLEARVESIERQLANKITLETLNSIEALKTEVQQLHGKLDEQQHAMDMLAQRQEKLFLDLEQRIGQPVKTASSAVNISINPATGNALQTSAPPKKSAIAVPAQTAAQQPAEARPKIDSNKTVSEQTLYNDAYKLVNAKRYQEAQVALQDFLWQFPEGPYAANAHYWLGEIYLSAWHSDRNNKLSLEKAISSFKTVTNKYSTHHKAADSLLKLGIIESDQQNWAAAKEYFIKLKQQYPGSSRAHMADVRLQKLRQQ